MGYFHDNYRIFMILLQPRLAVFSASPVGLDGTVINSKDSHEAGLRSPQQTQPLRFKSGTTTVLVTLLKLWCANIMARSSRALSAISQRRSRYSSDDCPSRSSHDSPTSGRIAESVKATHTATVYRTIMSPETELKFDGNISISAKRFEPQSPPRRQSRRKLEKQR